jgi:hypothetical protein
LILPFDITARFYDFVYEHDDRPLERIQPDAVCARRDAYRRLLRETLIFLSRWMGIDCVLSAAVHYRQDYDWGVAAKQVGIPFLILHRENLIASTGARQRLLERMANYRPFEGTQIAVHNEPMRALLIESGYVDPGSISALGALRMDPWIGRKSERLPPTKSPRIPTISFFSFGPAAGIIGAPRPHWPSNARDYLYEFCRRAHLAALEFAKENPDIRVVIKPKWGGDWLERLHSIWREHGHKKVPSNLIIDTKIGAQSLILQSDVVVAFNSTVLLEAGIVGKPVIFPLFEEANSPKWRDFVMFYDQRDAFDVASGPLEMKLLMGKLLGSVATSEQMKRRRELFEQYVSPLQGGTVERYRNWIARSLDPHDANREDKRFFARDGGFRNAPQEELPPGA